MARIKDLPNFSRPREKLIEHGPAALKDHELIAILLHTGYQGKSALELARQILRHVPLHKFDALDIQDLAKIKGVGRSRAASLVAAIELSHRVVENRSSSLKIENARDAIKAADFIKNKKREHLLAIYLNARNQIIESEIISVGTLTDGLVHPREIFAPAIRNHAAGVVIAHNHPSGHPEPSQADIKITKRLRKASELIGIELIDHIIITANNYYSFLEDNMI